jgi:Spy/CpxP family protein refolding chaperone
MTTTLPKLNIAVVRAWTRPPSWINCRLTHWASVGLLLVLGLMSVLPSGSLTAQAGGPSKRLNWAALNLSSEQHKLFLEAENDWRRTYDTIQPELLRLNGQMRYMMRQSELDEGQLQRMRQKSHSLQEQLQRKATDCFLRKKRALTPEQRQKFMQLMNGTESVDP